MECTPGFELRCPHREETFAVSSRKPIDGDGEGTSAAQQQGEGLFRDDRIAPSVIRARIAAVLEFEKYEGLGNDFIVVDDSVGLSTELAVRLCDRRRGIGADGVLQVSAAPLSLGIWNADGSRAEMCGNGLRCVALWHARRGGELSQTWFTDSGPHQAQVLNQQGTGVQELICAQVRVHMAVPSFSAESVHHKDGHALLETELEVGAGTVRMTAVSMGNPHVVVFDTPRDYLTLGPLIQDSGLFTNGVNVGFATSTEDGFDLAVLERGAGWTEACGTGACALAAAAIRTERAAFGDVIRVRLPGGVLELKWPSSESQMQMLGEARFVYSGRISLSS